MTERRWGAINGGAEFESMVTTLVYLEDSRAALFGRRGKDGGQDARSGDGTLVYQAKFHENGSAAKAIADAKKEAEKIRAYRAVGHSRHTQWQGVTAWRLVTNAAFNPTDHQTWLDEVAPLFAAQGLTADYWERAALDALLDRHPDVDRSYFSRETRAFLSLAEVRERLRLEEPFLPRAAQARLVGRDAEIEVIRAFLASDLLFLLIHGAGGMGKTRLLVEAGEIVAAEGVWQVLWANVETMTASGAWFQGIDPSRPTLLLVDEPRDDTLLRRLAEQLGNERMSKWKIAITVRTPKDPVVRFLREPRREHRVRELPINELSLEHGAEMSRGLLLTGFGETLTPEQRKDVAQRLANQFSRTPIWITLAIHLLDLYRDLSRLPRTAAGLADQYLEEIYKSQGDVPREVILVVIRWVALLGTVNRQDEASLKAIGAHSQVGEANKVLALLTRLVSCKALVQRGAHNRLVELKPDVLRDHVLQQWLTVKTGERPQDVVPADEAIAMGQVLLQQIRDKGLAPFGRAILGSLARTEFLLRANGQEASTLEGFFQGLDAGSIRTMSADARIAIADALTVVAPGRPLDTVQVARAMQASVAPDMVQRGLFRPQVIGQRDVIRSLAWPLFHAAMGSETQDEQVEVLNALSDIVRIEADDAHTSGQALPNDGKRPAALMVRLLEGGPQFARSFDEVGLNLAHRLVAGLRTEAPTPGVAAQVKAVVYCPASVERRRIWADERGVHFQTFAISPMHPAWVERERLMTAVKEAIVAAETPPASRIVLWSVFAESHRSLAQAWMNNPDNRPTAYTEELIANLSWAEQALHTRDTDVAELTAARNLWHWHYQFDETRELKEAATRLEQLYARNNLAGEFEHLLARDDYTQRIPRGEEKAASLAAGNVAEIHAFMNRAIAFVGKEGTVYDFGWIFHALGKHAPNSPAVRAFISDSLSVPDVSPPTELAASAAASWFAAQRGLDAAAVVTLLDELLQNCGSDRQRINLLIRLYAMPWDREAPTPGRAELDVLCGYEQLFREQERLRWFVQSLAHWVLLEWPVVSPLIDRLLTAADPKVTPNLVLALAEGVFSALQRAPGAVVPQELGTWLMDQVAKVPEFATIGTNVRWHLDAVLKIAARPSISWLAATVAERSAREQAESPSAFRALNGRERLSSFVAPLDVEQAPTETLDAIRSLIRMLNGPGTLSYLPPFLRDIDPNGRVVPAEIASTVRHDSRADDLISAAKVALEYGVGSPAWRAVAKPILMRVNSFDQNDRIRIYWALSEPLMRIWSSTLGEVPSQFIEAVKSAEAELDSETDVTFRPFWDWRLAVVEAQLHDQEQRVKEERGE